MGNKWRISQKKYQSSFTQIDILEYNIDVFDNKKNNNTQ